MEIFFELQDLTWINILPPSGYPFVVYSHKKKETFFSVFKGSHPLFPFLNNFVPKARYKENSVVFDISSHWLMINKEEMYKNKANKIFLDNLFDGLTEDSNPVLAICHLNPDI
jgi:hypothetical protein